MYHEQREYTVFYSKQKPDHTLNKGKSQKIKKKKNTGYILSP